MFVLKNVKKQFSELDEEKIIRRAQSGEKEAMEYLLENNLDIVYSKSKMYFIKGLDQDDVIQEGMIGLYKAIKDYRFDRPASFRGFAHMCVNRQLISAIKTANRQKHIPLNNSTSIDKKLAYTHEDGGKGRTLLDILPDEGMDPEKGFIVKETLKKVSESLQKILTPLEWKVFMAYLQGKSYKEISDEIEGNVKTVDNALQRSRRKIRYLRRQEGIAANG